ncbi:hypothetical protein Scep_006697 [Stephania cephalantha]|uniref:Cytochrome P450 n=1 Tax=Stephania cephalantha TaxID=152367 RepID=A0AAP0PN74_9MAGN
MWSWWCELITLKGNLIFTISLVVFATLWYSWLLIIKSRKPQKLPLPPGPSGLPFVGNLPFINPDVHRCFADLARTYGPIMKIKLGQKLCVVLSSTALAKEALRDYDTIFADRDTPTTMMTLTYGGNDLVWSSYGQTWRMLRKVCVGEMLSKTSLDTMYASRRREVRRTIKEVHGMVGKPINMGEQMFLTMSNLITSMLWGVTLKDEDRNSVGAEFRRLVSDILKLSTSRNLADIFPLGGLDVQGLNGRTKVLMPRLDEFFDSLVERRETKIEGDGKERGGDLLQWFLRREAGDSEDKQGLTMMHLKSLFIDMVVAGTDTSSVTVEWAMAELMNNPQVLKRAQEELAQVVGMNNIVEEHHLPKLHYLNAVIKEVMRVHPVAPLLLPRRSRETCTLNGYTIPKGTQILVNTWAIHRDPENWDNPTEFEPERFLKGNMKWDYNGNDFRYLPFGSGRRICAGIALVERMMPHVLGSLLHSFNWRLAEGVELDLTEKFMIILKKAKPTVLVAEARLSNPELYA